MDIQPACVQGNAGFKLEIRWIQRACMEAKDAVKPKINILYSSLMGPRRRTVTHVNCFDTSGSTTVADAVATQATICDLEPE